MSTEQNAVKVHILDKEYLVACPEGEQDSLLASAKYLNNKMTEIRAGGKVVGIDRITVMTALNLAHEIIESDGGGSRRLDTCGKRLQQLNSRIETALNHYNLPELG